MGFLPGKRESVRFIGDYVLTQNDIEEAKVFDDCIAYGGWPMDDHNPKGMKANEIDDEPSIMYPAPSPYGIPYRVIYSKNIENLFFAGRNISATHAAMSSTRVMATCSLLGQAMGTAAGMCVNKKILPREISDGYIKQLQQKLLENGVFLPDIKREISEMTKKAKLNICDKQREILFNGIDRPRSKTEKNFIELEIGETLEFEFAEVQKVNSLRIQFDLDYERASVSPNMKMQWFAQRLNRGLDFVPVKVANTIVKDFEVYADGVKIYGNENNYYSLVKVPINLSAKKIIVRFNKTWGAEQVNIFACDFI